MAQGARTLLQSSRASGLDLGLITLATGSASVAETCAEATIALSSAPFDGVTLITASGVVTMRVVSRGSPPALDCGRPVLPGPGGALEERPSGPLPL